MIHERRMWRETTMLHEGMPLCKGTMLREGRGDIAVRRDEAMCVDDIHEEDAA